MTSSSRITHSACHLCESLQWIMTLNMPLCCFYLSHSFWGSLECYKQRTITGNYFLLVLKGQLRLARVWTQAFKIKRKQSLRDSFELHIGHAPGASNFKVLCFEIGFHLLTGGERVGKESCCNTVEVWHSRLWSLFHLSFRCQVCVYMDYEWGESRKTKASPIFSCLTAGAKRTTNGKCLWIWGMWAETSGSRREVQPFSQHVT